MNVKVPCAGLSISGTFCLVLVPPWTGFLAHYETGGGLMPLLWNLGNITSSKSSTMKTNLEFAICHNINYCPGPKWRDKERKQRKYSLILIQIKRRKERQKGITASCTGILAAFNVLGCLGLCQHIFFKKQDDARFQSILFGCSPAPRKSQKTVRLPGGKTIYCKPPTISAVKEGRASASYLSLWINLPRFAWSHMKSLVLQKTWGFRKFKKTLIRFPISIFSMHKLYVHWWCKLMCFDHWVFWLRLYNYKAQCKISILSE